jgi:predicted protein tyrosine phosphatase
MQVLVYSRGAIERVPPQEVPHVVISITSAPGDVARIPASPLTRAILRLSFADADVAHDASLVLFDGRRAREVAAFVRAHREHVALIVVHCDAGLSRSPAVAAAITKWLGEDDSPWFARYRPNMLVYRTLLNELMSDPELDPELDPEPPR